MKNIRSYVYAAILAASALNLSPTPASAQEAARGKFTLTHEVHLGDAKLPAGEYEFSFDPDGGSRMLSVTKLSGNLTRFIILVPDTEEAKSSDRSRLVLESTPDGTYVSAMQLPEFGMSLHFTVPSHPTERQIAKAAPAVAERGQ
jgi:hypothetical protein